MDNGQISRIFRDMAMMLEIKGENPFRIRAYERAAQNIEALTADLGDFIKNDTLSDIPGIGKDLADKIKEFANTGKIKAYGDLKKAVPEGLLDILSIPSVGPKTAKLLYEKLNIKNVAGLEKAINSGKLDNIEGIKQKTVENILKGIQVVKKGRERITLGQAQLAADEFLKVLGNIPGVKKLSTAGSLRRQKETVRDIDILAVSDKPNKIMDAFVKAALVKDVLAHGDTKSSVRTNDDVQIDCRVVPRKAFGAALLYFTGSKNFNIKLRQMAIKKGLKINEYGVFKKEKFLAGKTEEDIFRFLKMAYVEPELREDTGEVELALKFKLPQLLELKDIKGDLHTHSTWSDGNNSVEEMALVAKKRGYSYIAITDHSQSLKIAGGLSPADLKKKKREIDKLNEGLKPFRILYGTEVDIDSDGKIDYKDDILKEFDIVVAAVHTGFKQPGPQLTKRVVSACNSKYVHIISHPTGRLWGSREAYDIDLEEVCKAAADTNTALEINAFPMRLDLNDMHARRAKELGARLAIGSDSHEVSQLEVMKFGVAMARRGWLNKNDVINTFTAEALLKEIRK
ncbi:MAG: DNA polymerase/3'-5' exonuclease PolX [Candidatus Omnitrophica bacterium]|nr:DNA polymerase/3'-5' exonuclease PolX [Candidatus Omnitrophota bacterium]